MAIFLHAQALNERNVDKAVSTLDKNVKVYRLTLESLGAGKELTSRIEKASEANEFSKVAELVHPSLNSTQLHIDTVLFENSEAIREMLVDSFRDDPDSKMEILWHQRVGNKIFAFERKNNGAKEADLLSVYEVENDLIKSIWITVLRRAEVKKNCNGLFK